jgi:hypothetical protein
MVFVCLTIFVCGVHTVVDDLSTNFAMLVLFVDGSSTHSFKLPKNSIGRLREKTQEDFCMQEEQELSIPDIFNAAIRSLNQAGITVTSIKTNPCQDRSTYHTAGTLVEITGLVRRVTEETDTASQERS